MNILLQILYLPFVLIAILGVLTNKMVIFEAAVIIGIYYLLCKK